MRAPRSVRAISPSVPLSPRSTTLARIRLPSAIAGDSPILSFFPYKVASGRKVRPSRPMICSASVEFAPCASKTPVNVSGGRSVTTSSTYESRRRSALVIDVVLRSALLAAASKHKRRSVGFAMVRHPNHTSWAPTEPALNIRRPQVLANLPTGQISIRLATRTNRTGVPYLIVNRRPERTRSAAPCPSRERLPLRSAFETCRPGVPGIQRRAAGGAASPGARPPGR